MTAVSEGFSSAPDAVAALAVPSGRQHRVVAVSVDATELLRPASDLLRLVEGARYVDVLLAAELARVAPAPLGLLAGSAPADPFDDDEPDDPLAAEVARLDVSELHVHRLNLRSATGPAAEDDLVAALSELVGFDPDPGVYLLGPSGTAPGRVGVQRAVQRVARVYGLPLRRYRCHELTVVEGVEQRAPRVLAEAGKGAGRPRNSGGEG